MEVIIKRAGIKQVFYRIVILFIICVLSMIIHGCGCFYQQMKGETPPPAAPAAKAVTPPAKGEREMFMAKAGPLAMGETFAAGVAPEAKVEMHAATREAPVIIELTCRKYLFNGQDEEPGYGLYSYVLLIEEPGKNYQMEKGLILFFGV